MTEPLHLLKHEHRVIEQALRSLDGICKRLSFGESVPAETLAQLVDFIGAYTDGYHHAKEEQYLFPALARQGIAIEGGPLGVMMYQHELERALTAAMLSAVEDYRLDDPTARDRFIESAVKYMDHLLAHMEKEDSILFKLADEVLDDVEKDALSKAFKNVERQLPRRTQPEYEQMATELEERWGV
jgi:hemerythrin-like domain-containing protein